MHAYASVDEALSGHVSPSKYTQYYGTRDAFGHKNGARVFFLFPAREKNECINRVMNALIESVNRDH